MTTEDVKGSFPRSGRKTSPLEVPEPRSRVGSQGGMRPNHHFNKAFLEEPALSPKGEGGSVRRHLLDGADGNKRGDLETTQVERKDTERGPGRVNRSPRTMTDGRAEGTHWFRCPDRSMEIFEGSKEFVSGGG